MEPAGLAAIDLAVSEFDGKHVGPLGDVTAKTPWSANILDHLINLCTADSENTQIAGSWMLKTYLDQGASLSVNQSRSIVDNLADLTSWQAQLHLAQSFSKINVPHYCANEVVSTLQTWFRSDHKFLRAWACDALWRLGQQHEDLRQTAIETLLEAETDTAASVRARARNLLKLK